MQGLIVSLMALSDGRASLVKNVFLEIRRRKITGVLYKQNKPNKTIQRHESDVVV